MFPSLKNPTTLFLMEGVFIFETQVYQKLEMRFPLYEHSFHFSISSIKLFPQLLFFFYKNMRNGKNTSLVLFLSLKIMGIVPRVYK
jgi:hypothetical protein